MDARTPALTHSTAPADLQPARGAEAQRLWPRAAAARAHSQDRARRDRHRHRAGALAGDGGRLRPAADPAAAAVGRRAPSFNTLTLNYEQRWLYGPNIYEHLSSSFARAITGLYDRRGVRHSARPAGRTFPRGARIRRSGDPVALSDPRHCLDSARDPVVRARQHRRDLRRVHRRVLPALLQHRSRRPQHQPDPGRRRALLWRASG